MSSYRLPPYSTRRGVQLLVELVLLVVGLHVLGELGTMPVFLL